MAKVSEAIEMVEGGGPRDGRWFVRFGGNGARVPSAVLELDEVALSKPELDIPGQGMFPFRLLDLRGGRGDKLGTQVSVVVCPMVAHAVAFRDNSRSHHSFGGVGTRDSYDVEAEVFPQDEPPALMS